MIVKFNDDQVITELKVVATYFNKEHKRLLKDIRRIIEHQPSLVVDYIPTTYADEQGKTHPTYYLTQRGFSILCMGFTGAKALEMKVKFYNEFERLRDENKQLRLMLTNILRPELNEVGVKMTSPTTYSNKPIILTMGSIISHIERLRDENKLHTKYLNLLSERNDNTVCVSDICCKFKNLAPNVCNNMLIEWDIITRRESGYYPNFDYLNGGYVISASAVNPRTNHLDNYVRYTPKGVELVVNKLLEVGYETI